MSPVFRLTGLSWALSSVVLGACASAGATGTPWLFEMADPPGDIRLEHPAHPDLDKGTFDLERVKLERLGDRFVLEVTFVSPVKRLTDVRPARDRVVEMVPMTIDVYLDTRDGGHLEALPGRAFRVPAGEAWDHVLVLSELPDLSEDGLIHAQRVAIAGRRLRATFLARGVEDVRGVLVVVLATSSSGSGRVRQVGTAGECRVWEDFRCVLIGNDPPIIDALGEVMPGRPVALHYADGQRPTVATTPVIFVRGKLVGVAPVEASQAVVGRFATVVDAAGKALATAVVVSVVGDTASLEVVGEGSAEGGMGVVFDNAVTPRP